MTIITARIIIFFISLSPIFKELNILFLIHAAKYGIFLGIYKGKIIIWRGVFPICE
jgi:hypothetical protein